jgi:hypothetical protein
MRAIFVEALYIELSSGIAVITDPGTNSRVCFKYNGIYLTEEITGKEANEFGFISDFTVTEYINWLKKANDMVVIDNMEPEQYEMDSLCYTCRCQDTTSTTNCGYICLAGGNVVDGECSYYIKRR